MLYIHGIGHYHPDNVIDNQLLEELNIGTDNQWIMERVGINTRRTVLNLDYLKSTLNADPARASAHASMSSAETAEIAVNMALARAKLSASDIGMVIAGGCAPEYSLPANACIMAAKSGITAPCLDVSSACSSFAAQMDVCAKMGDNLPDYVLLIQAENWTKTIDYSDRRTAVLIGDATVATIVSSKHRARLKVTHTTLTTDPTGWEKVQTPAFGHFYQEGPAVQKFAIKKTIATYKQLAQLSGKSLQDNYFIGHQANLTMLNSVAEKLALAEGKHLFNIDQFGNCGAAGCPSVLSQHFDSFKAGDGITIVVVGAGLTWGGFLIEVSE